MTDKNDTTETTDGDGLPSRLLARRKALGLSQSAAAAKTGVTLRTWQRWESGETNAHVGYVPALAQALQTTTEELLGSHGDEIRQPRGLDDLALERRLRALEAGQAEILEGLRSLRDFLGSPRDVLDAADAAFGPPNDKT